MTKMLQAKPIIRKATSELKRSCSDLKAQNIFPKLSVILVGDNSASKIYVRNKERFCKKLGIEFDLIELDCNIEEHVFLNHIDRLNKDDSVTGFFVQLPLPKQLKHLDVTQLIHPHKDVDGFNLHTISNIYINNLDHLLPCTPKGILNLLDYYQIEISSKHVVIIGRSYIVGKPLSLLLSAKDATVTLCHSKTKNLKELTKIADIIISAVGNPLFIDQSYLNQQKKQTLIDVGISEYNGSVVGDVNFDDVKDHIAAITPVPGGVGPMTVLSLMQNIIKAANQQLLKESK